VIAFYSLPSGFGGGGGKFVVATVYLQAIVAKEMMFRKGHAQEVVLVARRSTHFRFLAQSPYEDELCDVVMASSAG